MKPQSVATSTPSEARLLKALGGDLKPWRRQCHQASLHLVRSGAFGQTRARVARGWARGVTSQHSWVVLGGDCYNPSAVIVDPTLWSYNKQVKGIWIGNLQSGIHTPHGRGNIWAWGKPCHGGGRTIKLTPKEPLSEDAKDFLELLGPLDRTGWHVLAAQAPVEGWPAGEIYAAMDDTRELMCLVPIDHLGMLTDRNPGNNYW